MIRNYLKIAFRNLSKNLNYTLINVFGLAFGMACCFLIGLYIRHETSYEDFHEKKESIYRFIPRSSRDGELAMQTYTPAGLAPWFANQFSEIKSWTRYVRLSDKPVLVHKGEALAPEPLALADSSFFSIFSFDLVRGDVRTVLQRPLTVVISQSIADRFFPGQDPIGRVIEMEGKLPLEITGVFQNPPPTTHLKFSYLVSFSSLIDVFDRLYGYRNDELFSDMGAWNYSTYFLIPGADPIKLQKELSESLHKHLTGRESIPDNFVVDWLQPLDEIHFTKGIKSDAGGTGSRSYVLIFSCIALFVLLIACFNFINLSTALALRRAKEVGLRKTVGASRGSLIAQFLGETVFFIVISFIIALQLVELVIPHFNRFMDLELVMRFWSDPAMVLFILLTGLITALIAGGYPAFYLSSFQASRVFRGTASGSGKSTLRKVLTIGQFGIATIMIIGTLVVFQQMNHMKNASLGFDKELVITLPATPEVKAGFDSFKSRLQEHSGIKAVTLCGGVPGRTLSHWSYKFPDGEAPNAGINTIVMDYDYLDVIGLSIKEGRAFSKDIPTDDSLAYILNETAVKKFGLTNPVGTRFQVLDGEHGVGEIVGVVKDFHYRSLQHQVDPLVLRIERGNAWVIAVKLTPGNLPAKLDIIKKEWNSIAGQYPFDYTFLDEEFDKLYRSEEKVGLIMTTFSALAIIVACLGLLGLTSFFTEQRKREIGIRKVHGASDRDIIKLLSWDFIKLVLIGFAVTAPLAWYVASVWLENFAYRTKVEPLLFIASGLALGMLALVTVSYQSYKSSRSNPVDVLKET